MKPEIQVPTPAPEHQETCGHEFPVGCCKDCTALLCSGCVGDSEVCACCGGDICPECVLGARQRLPEQGFSLEYLCSPCAEKQDAARLKLIRALHPPSIEGLWLADIVSDLESAVKAAKEAL